MSTSNPLNSFEQVMVAAELCRRGIGAKNAARIAANAEKNRAGEIVVRLPAPTSMITVTIIGTVR